MLAIIQEIGVIQSVIIAACFGFMLGMLVVIVGERKKTAGKDDYIDWSKVPKSYVWVSVDNVKSGGCNVFAFQKEPYISQVIKDPQTWLWSGGDYIDVMNAIIGPLPPWRESLRSRPS